MNGSRLVPAKYRIRSSHTLLPTTSRWFFLRSWKFFSRHHLSTGCQKLGLVRNEYEAIFQRRKDGRGPTDKHHPPYANIKMHRAVPQSPYKIPKKCYTRFSSAVPLQCFLSTICIQDNAEPLFIIELRLA